LSLSIALVCSATAFGQLSPTSAGNPPVPAGTTVGSLIVYLRSPDGQPLPDSAVPLIHVSSPENFASLPNPQTRTGDGWMITGLPTGHVYQVQVSASGYLPASETVDLPDLADATASAVIFMRPVEQSLVFRAPGGNFVLAPNAQKEIQRALQDLQSGKTASAQKHAQKAINLAPANPYTQYVMGMTYLLSKNATQAKPYLEKSVSIDPGQSSSLVALGTVRYQLNDYAGAIEVLSKAVQLDTKSWKCEWLLAASYLELKRYPEARDHANRALKIDRQKAGGVQLLLGQSLAAVGDRDGAAQAFEAFAAQYPNDANAQKARELAKLMREPPKPAVASVTSRSLAIDPPKTAGVLAPPPPVEVPPPADWAPPDVDAMKPFVVSNATCPLDRILKRAGSNAEQLVTMLQEFSAREDFQEIEIKRGGQLERPDEHAFTYLVFIDRVSPQAFDVKEFRNAVTGEAHLRGPVADIGVPAMALAFHPIIQPSLDWKCEGLGTWNDHPAWIVHFAQRRDRPNNLASFSSSTGNYALPLKGRAWVLDRTGQVIHLDTDLMNPIDAINLKRQHFSIDYQEVSFRTHKVALWLPESADTYYQYAGHFLHYYHHFSDFKLFWVGATQKIADPKNKEAEPE